MQPFGVPRVPKVTTQTRKQLPVHRYPAPQNVVQQEPRKSEPPTQPSVLPPEDDSHIQQNYEQNITPHNEKDTSPSKTPEGLGSSSIHNRDYHNFQETPASFLREPEIDVSVQEEHMYGDRSLVNIHPEVDTQSNVSERILPRNPLKIANKKQSSQGKVVSPEKRRYGARDDDEYVRMASADEGEIELDEDLLIDNQTRNIDKVLAEANEHQDIASHSGYYESRPSNFGQYKEDNQQDSKNAIMHTDRNDDGDVLLKLKRLELELSKEKNKAGFLESERDNLIHENAQIRKKAEELYTQVELAKRYDNTQKLAKKEEEVEGLKLDIIRLTEDNKILIKHVQSISQENARRVPENHSLTNSLQEENRRLREELHFIKQNAKSQNTAMVDQMRQRNQLLEDQLYELRQQNEELTFQLTQKDKSQSKINNFNEGIKSLISSISFNANSFTRPSQSRPEESLQTRASNHQTEPISEANQILESFNVEETYQPLSQIPAEIQPRSADSQSKRSQNSPSQIVANPGQISNAFISVQDNTDEVQNQYNEYSNTYENPEAVNYQQVNESGNVHMQTPEFVEESPIIRQEQQQVHYAPPQEEEEQPVVSSPAQIPPHHESAERLDISPHNDNSQVSQPEPANTLTHNTSQGSHPNQSVDLDEKPPVAVSHRPEIQPKFKVPTRLVPKKPVVGFKPSYQPPQSFPVQNQSYSIEHKVDEISAQEALMKSFDNASSPSAEEKDNRIPPEIVPLTESLIQETKPPHFPAKEKSPEISELPPISQERRVVQEKPAATVNRPPLFNVSQSKAKLSRGKNPFSEESDSQPQTSNIVPPKVEEIQQSVQPVIEQPIFHQQPQGLGHQERNNDLRNSFMQSGEEGISSEAAENFFDQLGHGQEDQSSKIDNPSIVAKIEETPKIIENKLVVERQEPVRMSQPQIAKALPMKKKKLGLPTNMFD